ncbi:MAG: hypothetical protein MUC95_10845 [Spirochaetes bacterium]|jgi:hypothetical protein|nr:hypothetical protein [Spirochaetota bacterium]
MIFSLLLPIFLGISTGVSLAERVRDDINLVVPGIGSEKIVLKEEGGSVISKKGYPDSVSQFDEKKELFHHVFGVNSGFKIFFTRIYYYERQKSVFFIYDNTIVAIAGTTNSRITSDAVDFKKGVAYFIFGYGNNKLKVITKSGDRNTDKIYLYPEAGIAVIDDGDDDTIDMYLVFPKN